MTKRKKIAVAILGATGTVGQRCISLLSEHPNYYIAELSASTLKQNQTYRQAVKWKNEIPLRSELGELLLMNASEINCKYVISALPTQVAQEIEPLLAKKGHLVFSNASAFRMHPDVPILIPEVNLKHLELLQQQNTTGKILTNPNCVVAFLTLALAPLMELSTLEKVSVVTLQAASGAGYPGVSAYDLLGNTIPFIEGEEDKIQNETKKILGTATQAASFEILAHVNRVPVLHGHSMAIHAHFKENVHPREALLVFRQWNKKHPKLFKIHEETDRPQAARDLSPHDTQVHIGRIKQANDPKVLGLVVLGHNLVRGAAGAAIANMSAYTSNV